MAVSKQTEERARKAAEERAKLFGTGDDNTPQAPEEDPVISQEPQAQAGQATQEPKVNEPAAPEPEPEPQADPQPQPEPQPSPEPALDAASFQEEIDKWRQRYRTLQGKYNAEVKGSREENAELKRKVDELTTVVESMQAKTPTVEQKAGEIEKTAGSPVVDPRDVLTPNDYEEWGQEMIDMINKLSMANAKTMADGIVSEHLSEYQKEIGDLKNTQKMSAQEMFLTRMNTLVPDWEDINATPEFAEWLLEPDGLSDVPRHDNADNRLRNLDADGLAKYFMAFKRETAKQTPPPPPPRQNTAPVNTPPVEQPNQTQQPVPQPTTNTPPQNISPGRSHTAGDILYNPEGEGGKVTIDDLRTAAAQAQRKEITLEQYQDVRNRYVLGK